MAKIKASDYLAEFLRAQKTTHVFEVAGGMITHLIDSLYRLGNTQIISVHHEQAAAFAAEAYGRFTKRPGIALATSGPGATNLLTGIGSCYFDSSPALFITGQVNIHEQKSKGIRQLGFQETDIISMAKPITKKCFAVEKPEELEFILQTAYETAISGRPGPVLIDIPMNIQSSMIEASPPQYIQKALAKSHEMNREKINALSQAIHHAKRPLILAGQGIRCADAIGEFHQFVKRTKIPVVTSLLGLDTIAFDDPFRVGFIGSYGNRWANLAIAHADLLINIGSRLDIRQTGADVASFSKDKIIFHIDCDEQEINNRVKDCISIVSDAKAFLNLANERFQNQLFIKQEAWITEILKLKSDWPDTNELKGFQGINPNALMHQLALATPNAVAYLADVGSHQMWAAQSLELKENQAFITSGGMGAMGFALPAAIGYCLSSGRKPVVAIIGDGAFQMNIQELQTIIRNRLPVKIIIINNKSLGMIRQFQDSYFAGRYQSTYWGYSAPNFVAIARAYGIDAMSISCEDEIEQALHWLQQSVEKPLLLEIMIDPKMNVYPKIAFGRPISEMEPFAKPVAMEGT